MTALPTPEEFLSEFFKEMLHTPDQTNRPAILKGWARIMELREEKPDYLIRTIKDGVPVEFVGKEAFDLCIESIREDTK